MQIQSINIQFIRCCCNILQYMHRTLLIKLQNLEVRNKQRYEYSYYSFTLANDHHFFSSCFDETSTHLSDDIIIPIGNNAPEFLELHRWENHFIMFTHEIDISDLKARITVKKKQETKSGQILSFMLILLEPQQIVYASKYISSISQHYLIVSNLHLQDKKTQERADVGPSFFYLKTTNNDIAMPVTNGSMCIKLPENMIIQYIKNGMDEAKTRKINTNQIESNHEKFTLQGKNREYPLAVDFQWAVNLYEAKIQNTLLLQAHELFIYDIEVKFDSYNEFANCKVKFVYGNKAFEIGNEFNTPKPQKIKKIIHFIMKSEEQQVSIIAEKNLKIIGHSRFYTDEIISYQVNNPKRKIIQVNSGRPLGTIKFKCQKGKNLSTPQNNKFWKESNKKKMTNYVLLSIQQFSVNFQEDEELSVVIKTGSQERLINNIPNLEFFNKYKEITYSPVVLTVKPEESVYLMVKKMTIGEQEVDIKKTDFIGIAIINFSELRLGINTVQIPFFKNQTKTATLNCLINKVTPYPFIKSIFQPEMLVNPMHKTLSLSVFMKKITFTPYYYTYRYENKNEVYCIVETNRVKKVLIMQHSNHDELTFVSSAGSDTLNFVIQHSEYVKIKITFLVSDIGQDEQIYGLTHVKMKISELIARQTLDYDKVQLKNQFGTVVGLINTEVSMLKQQIKKSRDEDYYEDTPLDRSSVVYERKDQRTDRGPFKSQLRNVKNDLQKVNESLQRIEQSKEKKVYSKKSVNPIRNMIVHQEINQSMDVRKNRYSRKNSIRYDKNKVYGKNKSINDSVKLPQIKKAKKGSLQQLIHRMKIRKRTARGHYEAIQGKGSISERQYKPKVKINQDRSMTEKQEDKVKDQQIEQKIQKYKDELKELKDDLEKEEDEEEKREYAKRDLKSVQWEDNEFARPQEQRN